MKPKSRLKEKKRFHKIFKSQKNLAEKKSIDPSVKKYFSKSGKINTHALNRAEKYDGISTLFITGKISKEKSVHLYFEKDIIEKSFQALKGFLGLRPVHLRLDGKVNAHILICYLSYTLLTTFRYFLQNSEQKEHYSGISTLQALEEISNIYRIYYKSDDSSQVLKPKKDKLSQVVTMTLLQEKIMKAVCPELAM